MAQALQVGQHIGTTGRFGEMNLDDDFAGGIRLLGIVGVAAGVHRHGLFGMRARRVAAHARLATRRAGGRSRPGAQQGILLAGREMALHLAPDPAVLPPVEAQHQQYQQDAQGNQPDLQITHV